MIVDLASKRKACRRDLSAVDREPEEEPEEEEMPFVIVSRNLWSNAPPPLAKTLKRERAPINVCNREESSSWNKKNKKDLEESPFRVILCGVCDEVNEVGGRHETVDEAAQDTGHDRMSDIQKSLQWSLYM